MARDAVGDTDLSVPNDIDFNHPYTPYDVQTDFMKTAYGVLQRGNGQVGILESPTGTGKSLSLICASLTWLRNQRVEEHEASLKVNMDDFKDEPDWIVEQMLRRKREALARTWEEREKKLEQIRQKEKAIEARSAKRRRFDDGPSEPKTRRTEEDDEWLLDEPDASGPDDGDAMSGLSKETKDILTRFGLGNLKSDQEEDKVADGIKIYYTSRTHSQLTQFIHELRRPEFPSSIPSSIVQGQREDDRRSKEPVKHLPLSSRQKLCINPSVARLGSLSAINDRCSELQKPKAKDKCPYTLKEDNITQTHQFRDTAHATLPDIEDLYHLGKKLSVCPYYASRAAIAGAEIVTLPYPLLLQKNARDALGIKLEGNIVIVDEAHNIMDAVANVYASEVKLSELRRARQMLGVYVKRFGKKLKGENRVMVGQVGRVIEGLSEWMDAQSKLKSPQGIVDSKVLLRCKGVDQINLFRLIQYIQESKLAYKIESYVAHVEEEAADASHGKGPPRSSTPVLHILSSFLISLTNLSSEGRIFYEKLATSPPDIQLSYLLLSPTHAFSSIATSARAVILAGGTMSPFDDYKSHLFPYLPESKLTTLSCGHVIPPSNLCVWTLAGSQPGLKRDPNSTFEFSFQRRGDMDMKGSLGLAIFNLCNVVPDGVVVFFPSYGYLEEVVTAWKGVATRQGQTPQGATSLWDRLQQRKEVLSETRGGSSDEVLESYSRAILGDGREPKPGAAGKPRGALLLSVVGGKMSEGINFSDRLGRCVIIVGLPYPNINSPEWKAKTEYIETTTVQRLTTDSSGTTKMSRDEALAVAKQAARDFYENACMRAVNQSIGRAIRHQGDYAAIVLVDRRFGTDRIRGKLPGWIRGGLDGDSHEKGLPQLMGALGSFFRSKRAVGS
ncbi:DNA repair helicase [Colletotrichum higginsianum]|uniref:ATP-dependent DNA helicase CHL1 n=1 Tax=Colletotrichum higginsianum (strain IMI 349063) TaxID=759273 RepID=H1UVZ1_COLHI|nr:DNA repair helicase [Colletotrichum higginsianum IMI 349063]OBR16559.1 DNA repair helicase [Colletotrichum higginsianum IMI 349063]CCF32142.1 DNA repair helicase [Colletotrichum higginsianum]